MKKYLILIYLVWFINGIIHAQLSGNYYIPTSPPGFATVHEAVNSLNVSGVGGPVTFLVAAGYTENITQPIHLTATGSSGSTIEFRKDGNGQNPKIIRTDVGAFATSTLGGQGDAVIIIEGSDHVTFDGIDVAATHQVIEYGYYLRKGSATNGCKQVTIKNCVIEMTKGNSGFVAGIYASNNIAASTVSSALGVTVTSPGGRHENIAITGNTIRNVHTGILLRGYTHLNAPYDLLDQHFIIGSEGEGNTIQNFGGGSTAASYGIFLINHTSPNVNYNIINNADAGGSAATGQVYGIFMSTSGFGGDAVFDHNHITLSQSNTALATCIHITPTCNSLNVNNNTFSYGSFASTAFSYLINANNATNNMTITGNQTEGTINKTGTSGTFYGFSCNGNPTDGLALIKNNNFSNISVTGTSQFYGIDHRGSLAQQKVISGNTITNITGSTGAMYGIYSDFNITGTEIHSNTVAGFSNAGSLAPSGIYIATNALGDFSVYNNECYDLSNTVNGIVYGIQHRAASASSCLYFGNNIYNLTGYGTNSRVYGYYFISGSSVYVYNNFISALDAPNSTNAEAVAGILIANSASFSGSYHLWFNSIYLNATSSSVTTFGSSGISTGVTQWVEMKNNIIVNTSLPGLTGGFTVANRRTSTDMSNYASTSDNNNFYAGTPSDTNLIYFDGTNTIESMEDYKTFVSPRDGSSLNEMPTFENIALQPWDLHINPKVETLLKHGAVPVQSPVEINNDFDGDPRNPLFPDIGADEFEGTGIDINPPVFVYKPLTNTVSTMARDLDVLIADPSGVPVSGSGIPVLYWKINASGNWSGLTPVYHGNSLYRYTFGQGVIPDDTVSYYIVARDEAVSPHIGSSPSGAAGFTWDPPAASSPPPSPHYYRVYTAINAFPYHEGFETSKSLIWTTGIYIGTVNDWVIGTPAKSQLSGAHTGTKAYVTKTSGSTSHNHNAYVLSPHFDLTILDHPVISFWHNFQTEQWVDACIVEYTTDNGVNWHKLDPSLGSGANFNTLKSTNWYNSGNPSGPIPAPKFNLTSTAYPGHSSGWIQSTSDLKYLSGEIVQFRFRYGTDEDAWWSTSEGWAIDDVEVYNLGVVRPTGLSSTAISDEQIDLSFKVNAFNNNVVIVWNASGEFSEPEGVPPAPGTPFAGGTLLYNGTNPPLSHTELIPNTKYHYRAFSYDGLDYSPGVNTQAITFCDVVATLPWSEGFEDALVPYIPNCWFRENGDWVTANNTSSVHGADARTGNQFLRASWLAFDEFVWTPGFALEGGSTYDFSFWWAGDGYAGWTGDLFINTDPVSAGATQLGNSFVTDDVTTTLDYTQAIYNFSPSETGIYYFAIRVNCPTNIPWYLSFDDFSLDVATGGIDCPPPIAGNITTVYNGQLHTGMATVPTGAIVAWFDAAEGGNPTTAPSGTHSGTYAAWAETVDPGAGCTSDTRTQVSVTILPITLDFKVVLQGAYAAGIMNTDLYTAGQIPAGQPFNEPPWNYAGTETATPTPTTVDWILVELRTGPGAETMSGRFACLLNNDGTVSLTINDLDYPDIHGGSASYIVIWHRNHMPLMSATAKTLPVAEYDLTNISNIFGANAAIQLNAGVYGMISGDITNDGILQYSGPGNDRGTIISKIVSESGSPNLNGWITNGYWKEDLNLNNVVLYIGSANDRGYIIENLNTLTGEPYMTNLYYSVVPGAVSGTKTKSGDDGTFDLMLSSSNETVNVGILNHELLTNGLVDNIQFTLAWKSGDTEITDILASFQSDFMMTPQGAIKESDGISYQVFASVSPVYLPDPFISGETITVISFNNPEQIMFAGRLWIAEDNFTDAQNGMYYVSVWGHNNTGSVLSSALDVSDTEGLTGIRIYPNPVMQSHVNISFTSLIRQKADVSVYSMLGIRLAQQQFHSMANETVTTQLDLKGLPPGTYVVNISGENMVFRDLLIIK